jgi:single-stranded-DNA-specific exonuclease
MTLESSKKWIMPDNDKGSFLERLLEGRDIKNTEEFLNPKLENISFSTLYDIKKASKEILKAVEKDKKIYIHGDFDADGICATALLWKFLYRDVANELDKKVNVLPYIPDRGEQGYGLTESSIEDIKRQGGELIITVDCGIRDFDLIKKYKEISFVVTDHHEPPENFDKEHKYPIVHQMYPGHEYSNLKICGTTVVFFLIQQMKKDLGMEYEISEDTEGLDLVALATITDIMPLLDENRILVHYGLKQLSENPRTGIKKLCEVSKVEPKDLDTYHLGFLLGPRINVSGRIGDPLKAVKLLISQDEDTCKEIAYELNGMNYQRQEMTKEALDRAEKEIDTENKVAIYFDKDIHEGIVGLVAGKLQEKYHIPTLVITELEGELRGSARSINGFNVTDALEEASKHLERFGGHAQAAGFSLKKENLEKFKKEMFKIAKRDITKEMLVPELRVDMVINPEDISYDLLNTLNKLKPYGYGNPKPNMMISNIQVKGKRVLGQSGSHMKIEMEKEDGSKLSMIMFNCDEDIEKISVGSKVDVVGSVYLNIWNGNESLEFQVKEWKFS